MRSRDQGNGKRKEKPNHRSFPSATVSLPPPIQESRSAIPGSLYIVATPIGNLEDITLRALRILKEVDLIAAEDTRHSRKLLTHYGISKQLTSYYDHNQALKGDYLIERLQEGLSVALVSDAGTPGISDPGYQLVRDAIAAGITVIPLPGPCAAITALSAAGLPTDSFTFLGFLPNRQGKRRERLAELSIERRVLIFYEASNRLLTTLADMLEYLGNRQIVVARELTKLYEEFIHGKISTVIELLAEKQVRGEVVLMVAPADEPARKSLSVDALIRHYLAQPGMSVKDVVAQVFRETGVSKRMVYAKAIALQGK